MNFYTKLYLYKILCKPNKNNQLKKMRIYFKWILFQFLKTIYNNRHENN